MRIAFVSCMYAPKFRDQPVWDWIAAQQPDRLLLLGDSTYFDIEMPNQTHPRDMSEDEFAFHAWRRYNAQLTQPQFAALVASLPPDSIDAIWDDHDFLWDNVCGGEREVRVNQAAKVRYGTALLEAFRRTLKQQGVPGSFPAYHDFSLWFPDQPPATTPSLQLDTDLWLHLSDGRTYRTDSRTNPEAKRTIFGGAQRATFTQAIDAAPDAVHLFASGSTFGGYRRYPADRNWLKGLAATRRILMLSGDVHYNAMDEFRQENGGFPLQEATSSGAAVKDLVVVGAMRRNFGLVDIDPATVTIRLFSDNVPNTPRTIDRASWTF